MQWINGTQASNKDVRTFIISSLFILILIGMMMFLTFVEVPATNRDMIIAMISTFMGGGAAAMTFLFGSKDDDTEKLRREVAELKMELETVRDAYNEMVRMLVDRHVVKQEGIL